MDYMNYVKQSPIMGIIGYGGGATSLGRVIPSPTFKWYGDRAVAFGGDGTPQKDTIDYWSIASTNNATDFGDPTVGRGQIATASNESRGIFFGGSAPAWQNTIDYITFASPGNASNFGNATSANGGLCGLGSKIGRGVFAGGYPASVDMQFVDIATTGNATDAGDLDQGRHLGYSAGNGVRGVWAGGEPEPAGASSISYSTLASTANAADFGNMHTEGWYGAKDGISAGDRGIFAGGLNFENIQYVNIASTGNSSDFGDLVGNRYGSAGGTDNNRGFVAGGSSTNVIQYFTIPSTGNATDAGDLTVARTRPCGNSGAPS